MKNIAELLYDLYILLHKPFCVHIWNKRFALGVPHFVIGYDWQTRKVKIELSSGTEEQSLHLERDDDGRWWNGDSELTAFAGMNDIDLGITPSTNTLPIQRLGLKPGESASMTAVWIQFPSLTIAPLAQQYTRTGEYAYRYESNDGAYQADLEVDEHGLVTRYADVWSRAR